MSDAASDSSLSLPGSPGSFVDIPSLETPEERDEQPTTDISPLPLESIVNYKLPPIQVYNQMRLVESESPIERPGHPLYRRLKEEAIRNDGNSKILAMEVKGDYVTPVDGAGVWAFSGHKSIIEEKAKEAAWVAHRSKEAWYEAARKRTEYFSQPRVVRPALRWILVELDKGDPIPSDALQTGEENGRPLYSIRSWWEKGVHLGKAWVVPPESTSTKINTQVEPEEVEPQSSGVKAAIPYGFAEHSVTTFEILIGDASCAMWIPFHGQELLVLPTIHKSEAPFSTNWYQPVEGGREEDGRYLFVAQAEYEQGWHPGKAQVGESHSCIGYGCVEIAVHEFRILAWAV